MFSKIRINEFRQFKNKEITLGKKITVLGGRNATGKSTILGLLANSAEIKKKDGVTYARKQFRAEFGEIFHGSERFDLSKSNRFTIYVSDDYGEIIDYRQFRTTWQKDEDKKRFRIIPSKKLENGRKTESKMNYPVLYLGLSRLYPIGEANENEIKSKEIKFDRNEDRCWFIERYKEILSINDDIEVVDNFYIGETDKKSGVAITTETYDTFTNSSGQDNLGQLLMAILSFKRLKIVSRNWNGGLLLIDEIDSTLHPAAQKRLFDLLYKESKKNGFQIVLTTHSSDLLKHICSKTLANSSEKTNDIELYYFTTANRKLEVKRNISFTAINNDLLIQPMSNIENLKVYSEDKETRWFINSLLKRYLMFLDIKDIEIGCSSLLSLYSADIDYFGNVLIVLDGDVSDTEIKNIPAVNDLGNIIKLPGGKRPEEVIYDYLTSLDAEHPFWESAGNFHVTWQSIKDNGPKSAKYSGCVKDREKFKKWFNESKWWIDATHVYKYWEKDEKELVEEFVSNFIIAYNKLANRNFLSPILE